MEAQDLPEEPHLVGEHAGQRILDIIINATEPHRGKPFSALDPREQGRIEGLVQALGAAYHYQSGTWGGEGEWFEGATAEIADGIAWARQAHADWYSWLNQQSG